MRNRCGTDAELVPMRGLPPDTATRYPVQDPTQLPVPVACLTPVPPVQERSVAATG